MNLLTNQQMSGTADIIKYEKNSTYISVYAEKLFFKTFGPVRRINFFGIQVESNQNYFHTKNFHFYTKSLKYSKI